MQIGEITHASRTLAPDDSLKRAVEILSAVGTEAVAVMEPGRFLGLVTAQSIAENLPDEDPKISQDIPVSAAVVNCPVVSSGMPLEEVLSIMRDHHLSAVGVGDSNGYLHGIVTRTEVMGALWETIQMPSIGGMATPLGVHLTTGGMMAGPGHIGLILTGVVLALLFLVSTAIVDGIVALFTHWGIPVQAMLNSTPTGTFNLPDLVPVIYSVAVLVVFLILVRLSPLSGYHAAEHQVVHAIEENLDLVPEKVKWMDRPHPRCGTNLIVIFGLGMGLFELWNTGDVGQLISIPLIFILLMSWRKIGWFLQQYFTTKPASLKQLESGIRAGKQLMEAYRKNPGAPTNLRNRIWNAGFLQVLLGLSLTYTAGNYLMTRLWR